MQSIMANAQPSHAIEQAPKENLSLPSAISSKQLEMIIRPTISVTQVP